MRSRRHVVGFDRSVLTVLGVILVVGGAALVAVRAGWLSDLVPPDPVTDVSAVVSTADRSWWPAACFGAALLLVAAGSWWVLAHGPGPRTGSLTLPGSRTGDRLRVVPDAVTRAAQEAVESDSQVRAASLALREERGELVLVGRVRVPPRADVAALGALLEETARSAAQVLGRDVTGRVHVAVARRGRPDRRPG